jgi:hypothetical protein
MSPGPRPIASYSAVIVLIAASLVSGHRLKGLRVVTARRPSAARQLSRSFRPGCRVDG